MISELFKGTQLYSNVYRIFRTSFDKSCQIEGLREGAEEVSVMTEALVGLVPEVKSLHVVLNKVNHSRPGRGGFQPTYGPPAAVLGQISITAHVRNTSLILPRDGIFCSCLRRRDGLRVHQSQNSKIQRANLLGKQGILAFIGLMGGWI